MAIDGAKQRATLLDENCRGDLELRQEVESLLSREAGSGFGFSLIGEVVSHYRILDGLAGGGMGLVYRAEDLKLGRQVALKFLPEESAKDPAALASFEREARSASALEHPNICPIYEFGEHEGKPFLVMQLLDGQTLREMIAGAGEGKPPLEIPRVLDLALQIAEGLDAAHGHGIIHRDIKPANIFVTKQEQAKILDFGLAKVAPVVNVKVDSLEPESQEGGGIEGFRSETVSGGTPDPFLSRTGVAMGTAGYMSPEQARGEKLDARTDLFSLGLVLYEMATGQRAFQGDTGPVLHDAILHSKPEPARKVNPKIPTKLEAILDKALQKDREARYQSASEISVDLKRLTRDRRVRHARWKIAATIAFSLVFLAATLYWFATHQTSSPPEIRLRQLTASSAQDPVRNGALSPDGKYLAYADLKGIHLMLVKTGESQTVPQPEGFAGRRVDWQLFRWFPDGTRFLVNQNPPDERARGYSATIWSVPVVGGPPRKLRQDAGVESISPDGSLVAFTTDNQNVWLMGPNGEQVRKVYSSPPQQEMWNFRFSPNGERLMYAELPVGTLESRDLNGANPVKIPSGIANHVRDYLWLPDGRVVYSLPEPGPNVGTCNLWEVRVDVHTGKPQGLPRRLTNLPGVCAENLSATADGKEIAFQQWAGRSSVYIADVEANGTRITMPTRLTVNDSWNIPTAWTADSRSVVFKSSFNGETGVYQQRLDQDTPEPLVTGMSDISDHTPLSPDGSWFLYGAKASPQGSNQLLRVPVNGGVPQVVMTGRNDGVRCARSPSALCVSADRSLRPRLTLSTFDPMKGRGLEIAQISVDPESDCFWDLSPDGTRIAVLEGLSGRVRIISLVGEAEGEIRTKGMESTQFIDWTADGKAVFVSRPTRRGFALLRLDVNGNSQVMWEDRGGLGTSALPSPDGKHVAIRGWSVTSNFWTMINF